MTAVILGMCLTAAMAAAVWLNDKGKTERAMWVLLGGWFIVLTLGLIGGA